MVADFLRRGCPRFGSAVGELDIHVYFDTRKTGDEFRTPFDLYITKLPLSRFLRKKKSISLHFLTGLGDSRLVEGYGPPRFDLFVGSAREIVRELALIEKKLKPNDDFDYPAFRSFVDQRISELPKSEAEFMQLVESLHKERTPNQTVQTTPGSSAPLRV